MTTKMTIFRTRRSRNLVVWIPVVLLYEALIFSYMPWQMAFVCNATCITIYGLLATFFFLGKWCARGEDVRI